MTAHRLLPSGEQGRGMPQIRADQGGGESPVLHGAKRRKGGETRLIAKRGRIVAETVQPLRQGAGTGPYDEKQNAKGVVEGKRGGVRVESGGGRKIKKKKT